MATTKTKTKEKELELSPFANNGHATEYTKMMHVYADLDKREGSAQKAAFRKLDVVCERCISDWMCDWYCVRL